MNKETRLRREMLRWSRSSPRSFPWRETHDPYAVLIGEVLLQRTRGEHVTETYRTFLGRWPRPEDLASARVTTIAAVIRPLGLVKRAATLKKLGAAIAQAGRMPAAPEELEQFPGVGRYAAHAVPVFARGANLPLVDWVIARVLRRYFGMEQQRRPNQDPELWAVADRLVRRGPARALWLGVLDFAAAVCRPKPRCEICPLTENCSYFALLSRSSPKPIE